MTVLQLLRSETENLKTNLNVDYGFVYSFKELTTSENYLDNPSENYLDNPLFCLSHYRLTEF